MLPSGITGKERAERYAHLVNEVLTDRFRGRGHTLTALFYVYSKALTMFSFFFSVRAAYAYGPHS